MEHPFFAGIDWHALFRCKVKPPFAPDASDESTKYFDEQFTNMPVRCALLCVHPRMCWTCIPFQITASIQATSKIGSAGDSPGSLNPFSGFTYEDPSELAALASRRSMAASGGQST